MNEMTTAYYPGVDKIKSLDALTRKVLTLELEASLKLGTKPKSSKP